MIKILHLDNLVFNFKDEEDFIVSLICDFSLSAGQKIKIGRGKKIELTEEMISAIDRELIATKSFESHFKQIKSIIENKA